MKPPIIPRTRGNRAQSESGFTLLLVALAMVAIIAMAALAIDLVTLYLAREEAQRSADAGALAGARILSLSGVTGDPDNNPISGTTTTPWPAACAVAQQVAQAVAQQDGVDSSSPTPTVTFSYNGVAYSGCNIGSGTAFGLNPQVQVQVVRNSLPTLFSRIWGTAANTVSATATAEAYNSSDSENYTPSGDIVPVGPRCVKPWVIPNMDPVNGGQFVHARSGRITTPGIVSGSGTGGVIGETFTLQNPCGSGNCIGLGSGVGGHGAPANAGNYAPALISTTPIAVPSCANNDVFQQAVGGCDASTFVNACGAANQAQLDYTISPSSDTDTAVNCLIRGTGSDTLNPASFPFQITAGPSNPYASTGQPITASTSIVTLPIFNSGIGGNNYWPSNAGGNQPQITIIGFLQVFINASPTTGNMSVTVLNVSGCGDGNDPTTTAVNGSSPVPVRLITPSLTPP
jgi:hypothetical protein